MKLLLLIAVIVTLWHVGAGQLAKLIADQERDATCRSWSDWGPCMWELRGRSSNYLGNLPRDCRNHWFYALMRSEYGDAFKNFFTYVNTAMRNDEPCGMCSYRQSCCRDRVDHAELSPPFQIAEEVCTRAELGAPQQHACDADARYLKRVNGHDCVVWPSAVPQMVGVEQHIKDVVYQLKWASCVPDTRSRDSNGEVTVCKCCCYPFRPNPATHKCDLLVPGAEWPEKIRRRSRPRGG